MVSVLLQDSMSENGSFHDEQNIADAANTTFLGPSLAQMVNHIYIYIVHALGPTIRWN